MFIPERHEDVTADWLTEALRSGGVIGDESVREFQIEPLGADRSRTSSLARISVEYDGHADGLPRSMFAKFVSRIPGNRQLATNYSLFRQEIELYKNLGDSIPLNMPEVYFGRVSENGDVAVLLLEELNGVSKESLPPAQRTLTTSETKLAMSELSKMHARFWEDRALNEYEWLPGLDNDFRRWIYQSYDQAWA
ncbi:MAG: hypothetical protein QF898_19325, partial [SAR202 cluster bacterium]|nr:hypothetical protein [SAR202 cluster bacterium]